MCVRPVVRVVSLAIAVAGSSLVLGAVSAHATSSAAPGTFAAGALVPADDPRDHNPFEPWDETDPDVPPGAQGGQNDGRGDAVTVPGGGRPADPAQDRSPGSGQGQAQGQAQGERPALAETGFDAAAGTSLGLFTLAAGLGLVRLSRREAAARRR